jgi:NAD(P)-dependent dehydrogenase (short-subunit alcohol dehydrogenase family)
MLASSAVSLEARRLEGRVALVTGGGSGIGRAVALRLASEGATVAVAGRTRATLEETCRLIGAGPVAFVADLVVAGEPARLVGEVAARLRRLDILVNAAGAPPTSSVLEISDEAWQRTFDVNAKTMFFTLQAAARLMNESGGGRIVNFSSVAAKGFRRSQDPAYVGAKAAVVAITRLAAMRLAPAITVNAVVPGVTRTDPYIASAKARSEKEGIDLDEALARMDEFIPLQRSNEPADVAALVAFLVSDEARTITGQSINVDGGLAFD